MRAKRAASAALASSSSASLRLGAVSMMTDPDAAVVVVVGAAATAASGAAASAAASFVGAATRGADSSARLSPSFVLGAVLGPGASSALDTPKSDAKNEQTLFHAHTMAPHTLIVATLRLLRAVCVLNAPARSSTPSVLPKPLTDTKISQFFVLLVLFRKFTSGQRSPKVLRSASVWWPSSLLLAPGRGAGAWEAQGARPGLPPCCR